MKINPLRLKLLALLIVAGLICLFPAPKVQAQNQAAAPVARAVLFYRSTCSHCVQLVMEVMPPILATYGDRLQIFYCDISTPAGEALFTSAIDRFSIKTIGVPTLIAGSEVLLGSINIQQQFPGIIEAALSKGGLDWPDIPGLQAAFSTAGSMQLPVLGSQLYPAPSLPTSAAAAVPTAAPSTTLATPAAASVPTEPAPAAQPAGRWIQMRENFGRDVRGNSLALVILLGMLAALLYGMAAFWKKPVRPLAARPSWLIPSLCLAGAGVSAYLAYVEITLAEALCGPVGDCQAVQSSAYARLFGVLPVGLLGLAGYVVIALVWAAARFGRARGGALAGLALLGLTADGLLFSIYLTFLEPFIIGAVCLWCLASAVIMTVLFSLAIGPGRDAWARLQRKPGLPEVPA